MHFSLDDRTCVLSVGEFAGFTLGPRDAGGGGPSGIWRAQLGQQWHARLHAAVEAEAAAQAGTRALVEVPLTLGCVEQGWNLTFAGRVDQIIIPAGGAAVVREIKTVAGPLPAEEATLRAEHADYFVQLATYVVLLRATPGAIADPPPRSLAGELVFVELGTGLIQTVALGLDDELLFQSRLSRLVEFLNLRLQVRARLRGLRFRPAFAVLRPGQETIQTELADAFGAVERPPGNLESRSLPPSTYDLRPSTVVLFEAPTGYGKTGVLLEYALGQLRTGRFARLLYLTGKSTGQLQVMRTLAAMTTPGDIPEPQNHYPLPITHDQKPRTQNPEPPPPTPVAAWQVRPKSEHCVNPVFHCVRDTCGYLQDLEARWPSSGLARFYLRADEPRDLETLRAAGRDAQLCPYEITRAALPFNDVWIGDYNYLFAPDSRGVFYERPGFSPPETLVIIDEAHNLPARVADAWSHVARATEAESVLAALHYTRPPASFLLAWEHWTRLLGGLRHAEVVGLGLEDEARESVDRLASLVATTPLDYAVLGPRVSELLWQTLALRDWLAGEFALPAAPGSAPSTTRPTESAVSRLLWCPHAGELHFTCLDAAPLIGGTLRAFGGAILASATLQPADVFAAACGLAGLPVVASRPVPVEPSTTLGQLSRRARKTLRDLTSGAALLQVAEAREAAQPRWVQARAPWRDHAYRIGIDTRIDTTFQHRSHHYPATAATVEALHAAAVNTIESRESMAEIPSAFSPFAPRPSPSAIAVFFPSYAYADNILKALEAAGSPVRVAFQPRTADLATQAAWVEESLAAAGALFLVLGSSFAESIDLLGGRITHAMVVGPALPEVNAIQRERLAGLERAGLDRAAAFRRVYQIPGMQKVNQALGRLVRAPGQQATVLLHCRRFADPSYANLLAPEYRAGEVLATDEDLAAWLRG